MKRHWERQDPKIAPKARCSKIGFKARYSIEYGIDEIIDSIKNGFFENNKINANLYGNYIL